MLRAPWSCITYVFVILLLEGVSELAATIESEDDQDYASEDLVTVRLHLGVLDCCLMCIDEIVSLVWRCFSFVRFGEECAVFFNLSRPCLYVSHLNSSMFAYFFILPSG